MQFRVSSSNSNQTLRQFDSVNAQSPKSKNQSNQFATAKLNYATR